MPNENALAGTGKFERRKFGAPPIAVNRFATCARWSISSTATPLSRRFQLARLRGLIRVESALGRVDLERVRRVEVEARQRVLEFRGS